MYSKSLLCSECLATLHALGFIMYSLAGCAYYLTECRMKNKMYSIMMMAAILLFTILLYNLMKQRSQLEVLNVEVETLKTKVSVLELKAKVLKVEIDMVKVVNYRKIVKGWNKENRYCQKTLEKDENKKTLKQARIVRETLLGYPGLGL